jgi:hypothetical protein
MKGHLAVAFTGAAARFYAAKIISESELAGFDLSSMHRSQWLTRLWRIFARSAS